MKKSFEEVEKYRITYGPMKSLHGDRFGLFILNDYKDEIQIRYVVGASTEDDPELYKITEGWEHVSVSVKYKGEIRGASVDSLPTWKMMCQAKDFFFDPEECVIQFHPPKSQYVNNNEVLHLWKHISNNFPLPPKILV